MLLWLLWLQRYYLWNSEGVRWSSRSCKNPLLCLDFGCSDFCWILAGQKGKIWEVGCYVGPHEKHYYFSKVTGFEHSCLAQISTADECGAASSFACSHHDVGSKCVEGDFRLQYRACRLILSFKIYCKFGLFNSSIVLIGICCVLLFIWIYLSWRIVHRFLVFLMASS